MGQKQKTVDCNVSVAGEFPSLTLTTSYQELHYCGMPPFHQGLMMAS